MGSYDVDFDDYDEKDSTGYTGDEPKKGLYEGKLHSVKDHTSAGGNDGLEWIFEITEAPYAGWRGWVYSNMDSAKWKTQQIAKAITGGSEKPVKIKTTEEGSDSPTVKKASSVLLNIRTENFEDEKRAKIKTVLPNENAKSNKKKKKDDDPV